MTDDDAHQPNEEEAVLAANEAFYRAFSTRDAARMDRIWSQRMPVACIHPGWPTLIGRDAVMQSWHQILKGPDAPAIRCQDEHVVVLGTSAYLTCVEVIDTTYLAATNLFVRESGVWHLVLHQAGPTTVPDGGAPGPSGRRRPRPVRPVSVH